MDEVTHTIVEQPNNAWGGTALGAGFGGLIGSWLGNGGFGGFGGGANRGAIGYDTGAINAMQGQLNNISGQIANADRDLLMQTSGQNQFLGNLVNNTTDAIVATVNNNGRDTQAAIFQNTLTQTQNQGATNLAMCGGFNSVTNAIGAVNNNVSEQGYESRLQAQQLAAQQQQCCCQVIKAVTDEGCANRELQRAIQYEQTRDELAQSRAREASLANQLFTVTAIANQTQAIIDALKPTTTTAAG